MNPPKRFVPNRDRVAPQSAGPRPCGTGNGRRQELPAFIRIVLCQLAKLRHHRAIPTELFDQQIARLTREELQPRGLVILVRDLPDGRTRFLLKVNPQGDVHDLIEYPSPWEHFEEADAPHRRTHSTDRQA